MLFKHILLGIGSLPQNAIILVFLKEIFMEYFSATDAKWYNEHCKSSSDVTNKTKSSERSSCPNLNSYWLVYSHVLFSGILLLWNSCKWWREEVKVHSLVSHLYWLVSTIFIEIKFFFVERLYILEIIYCEIPSYAKISNNMLWFTRSKAFMKSTNRCLGMIRF